MSEQEFEAWLNEETAGFDLVGADKDEFEDGARAAWAKAQEEYKAKADGFDAAYAAVKTKAIAHEALQQKAEKLAKAVEYEIIYGMSGFITRLENALKEYRGESND